MRRIWPFDQSFFTVSPTANGRMCLSVIEYQQTHTSTAVRQQRIPSVLLKKPTGIR
jgi:hypothetical protein